MSGCYFYPYPPVEVVVEAALAQPLDHIFIAAFSFSWQRQQTTTGDVFFSFFVPQSHNKTLIYCSLLLTGPPTTAKSSQLLYSIVYIKHRHNQRDEEDRRYELTFYGQIALNLNSHEKMRDIHSQVVGDCPLFTSRRLAGGTYWTAQPSSTSPRETWWSWLWSSKLGCQKFGAKIRHIYVMNIIRIKRPPPDQTKELPLKHPLPLR